MFFVFILPDVRSPGVLTHWRSLRPLLAKAKNHARPRRQAPSE